ncbi:MAG: C45 family autoproteolytic acyltransferase/hydrolase [Methanobacterium sp.]|nr:C45 family autoproteolytic acyltransferase/hydrolase [Methanobacterium sp.]
MKKVLTLLIILFLFGINPVIAQGNETTSGELIATYDEGKLYKYGDLYLVELHGNYREMGRQYGALRKDILTYMNGQISNSTIWLKLPELVEYSNQRIGYDIISSPDEVPIKWIKSYYEKFPNYNEIMIGISETSGLGDRTYLICSPLKEIYILSTEPFMCSYVAAWGPYTTNSQLIAGRNYDWSQEMSDFSEIVVYNPDDGSIPVATMGYAASIYLETGVNKEGLFIEMNEGSYPEYLLKEKNYTAYSQDKSKSNPAQLEIFKLSQTSSNIAQLDENFKNTSTLMGVIVNAADENGSYSYECLSNQYIKRNPQENGLLVATNHFIDPSWQLSAIEPESMDDYYLTVYRMDNLMNLCEQNKGKITPDMMMQFISTPTEEGGALMPETVFQVVVIPHDLKIWFRAPLHYNWTEVDLNKHFS